MNNQDTKKPKIWNRDKYLERDGNMKFDLEPNLQNQESSVKHKKPPPLYRLQNVELQLESLHRKCFYLETENTSQKLLINKLQIENKKLLNIVQSVASKKKIVEKSKTSDKEPQKQLSNVEVKVKSIENKVKLNKEKSKTNEEEITVDVKTKLINDHSKVVKDLK